MTDKNKPVADNQDIKPGKCPVMHGGAHADAALLPIGSVLFTKYARLFIDYPLMGVMCLLYRAKRDVSYVKSLFA